MDEQIREDVVITRIGRLDMAEAENIIGIANLSQQVFLFSEINDINVDLSSYRLPNSGYDLDSAVEKAVLPNNPRRPLILLTSEPYGATKYIFLLHLLISRYLVLQPKWIPTYRWFENYSTRC